MICTWWGLLQVQAFKATGDRMYLDRAALFLKVYCDELQRDNGLFHHREDAPFFWGRGNGWAIAALTEILLVLPESHKHHAALLHAYCRMMQTLASYQGEDGMWHQLIDDPAEFPRIIQHGDVPIWFHLRSASWLDPKRGLSICNKQRLGMHWPHT